MEKMKSFKAGTECTLKKPVSCPDNGESFKPLGRKPKENRADRWIKAKQKERNRIEGSFGHGKQHFGMDRVKYQGKDGSEMWTRCCLLAMNLKTAAKKA